MSKLLEAILSYHANVYVTILNVIQAIALYLLATETKAVIAERVFDEGELWTFWSIIILRSAVALTMILVIWHRYVSECQYLWPMSWLDTVTPFFMGINEFVVIFFANPEKIPLWRFVLSIIFFEILVLLAYWNAYQKRKNKTNQKVVRGGVCSLSAICL